MKTFLKFYIGIIFLISLVGVILPKMLSAKDDLLVGAGVAIILLIVGITGGVFYNQFLNNKGDTK